MLLIGILNRIIITVRNSRIPNHRQESSLLTWIRRSLILPATFGKHCSQPVLGGTIPPRLESVLLGLYVTMNFIFMFPGYELFLGNL